VSGPRRIQLRRTKGWRLADVAPGAVKVTRPGPWGNPFRVASAPGGGFQVIGRSQAWGPLLGDRWTKREAAAFAVDRLHATHPQGSRYAKVARSHLAGRDLACWCPLDQPCHADWLLYLANGLDHDAAGGEP
jgi:hypothetical protein